jgi:hypothetical protein
MRSIELAFGKFELAEDRSSPGSLSGQRECLGFEFHIHASKRSYAAIKLCPLGRFKIGKESGRSKGQGAPRTARARLQAEPTISGEQARTSIRKRIAA